jgi:hypothetical protein
MLVLVCSAAVALPAAAQVRQDRTPPGPPPPERAPADPTEVIREFEGDPDHVYGHELRERPTWWDLFQRWLQRAILEPMMSDKARFFWRYVVPVLGVLGLAWALYRLVGGEGAGPFARRDRRRRDEAGPLLDVEEIADVDLDALLAEAREAGRLRDVVRYRYLLALQALAARGALTWRRDKTNRHYAGEVRQSAPAIAGVFDEASRVFAWVWYGDHPLDGQAAPAAERALDRLDDALLNLSEPQPAG